MLWWRHFVSSSFLSYSPRAGQTFWQVTNSDHHHEDDGEEGEDGNDDDDLVDHKVDGDGDYDEDDVDDILLPNFGR